MKTRSQGIFFIAVFDLVKAVFFLVAAVGIFHLVNRNTQVELTRLLHVFRINGDHAFIRNLLRKADVVTNPGKRIFTAVLLLYTGLYVLEGVGLLLRKRWAEYFAAAMTAIPLPFEAYELTRHAGHPHLTPLVSQGQRMHLLAGNEIFLLKIAVLIINVVIVWYLIIHLQRTEHSTLNESR